MMNLLLIGMAIGFVIGVPLGVLVMGLMIASSEYERVINGFLMGK